MCNTDLVLINLVAFLRVEIIFSIRRLQDLRRAFDHDGCSEFRRPVVVEVTKLRDGWKERPAENPPFTQHTLL